MFLKRVPSVYLKVNPWMCTLKHCLRKKCPRLQHRVDNHPQPEMRTYKWQGDIVAVVFLTRVISRKSLLVLFLCIKFRGAKLNTKRLSSEYKL